MKVLRICCRIKKISPPLSACLKSVLFWFDSYFTLKPFSPKFKYKFSLHFIVQSFNESSENLLPYQENISSVISLWTCVGFPIRVKLNLWGTVILWNQSSSCCAISVLVLKIWHTGQSFSLIILQLTNVFVYMTG